MGYRGGFSRKMKKKPEGGRFPPLSLWELGLRKYIRLRSKLPTSKVGTVRFEVENISKSYLQKAVEPF